ncbi:MAG: hypothetical protein NTV51_27595, partial [Verrucomicrobia bacterium]|nr:hypothetical protein [Verrucomicrobiota bacterium]
MNAPRLLTRRDFLVSSAAALAVTSLASAAEPAEPIIDIHQHTNYGGGRDAAFRQTSAARNHAQLLAHQRGMGVTKTILLPSGRPLVRPSTLNG